MKLPGIIPIFPLPNVVLFPRMPLPLHVFEPRYRTMVRDAACGPRLIGMVLLRGDWAETYHGRAPIFATGTVGEMVHVEELDDGRFNIVLRGLREYAIVREFDQGRPYREVAVSWREAPDTHLDSGARETILRLVRRYLERLGRAAGREPLLESAADGETFVNFFAQHLDVPVLEKQALLEATTLADRARRLCDVLEFRLEELAHPSTRLGRTH